MSNFQTLDLSLSIEIDVWKVSGGFEFSQKIFAASPVPGVNTCVPGRTR